MAYQRKRVITFGDAKQRRLVELPDGRTGRVMYVTPKSAIVKVLVGGRHYRLPADQLRLLPEAEQTTAPELWLGP